MSEIIVDFVGIVESSFHSLFIILRFLLLSLSSFLVLILSGPLLKQNLCSQLLQKFISLVQKLFDFIVLLKLYEFEVGLHILLFEGIEPLLSLFVLDHLLLLLLQVVVCLGLRGYFFSVFLFFPVPLQKFLLVDPQMLHKLLVLDLLAPLMVTLDLVFHLLDPIRFVAIFLQPLPPEVVPIEQPFLK
jgi:hypothetical protein